MPSMKNYPELTAGGYSINVAEITGQETGSTMKVVIVDDSLPNALLAQSLVQRLDFVETIVFTEPTKALDWCRASQPDLILLDHIMPEMDGVTFMERFFQNEENRTTPVIVITADDQRETLHKALECGATDFLQKPFDPTELIARTRNILKLRANQLELAETIERLHILATTDMLTQTANRRHFLERLDAEMSRSRRFNEPLCVAIMDADKFKNINDTYGHAGGDDVLRSLSAITKKMLRNHDLVGRFGGEEFALCMPETVLDKGVLVANRVREAIADMEIPNEAGPIKFTVSIGITQYDPEKDDADILMNKADALLYDAKNQGRNRVVS